MTLSVEILTRDLRVAPGVGVEPTMKRLTAARFTAKLPWKDAFRAGRTAMMPFAYFFAFRSTRLSLYYCVLYYPN